MRCALGAGLLLCGPGCYRSFERSPGSALADGGRGEPPDAGGPRDSSVHVMQWVPFGDLPPLPDGCYIERATDPAVVLVPRWLPCGEGCLHLQRHPELTTRLLAADYRDEQLYFLAVVERPIRDAPDTRDRPVGHIVLSGVERPHLAIRERWFGLREWCGVDAVLDGGHILVAVITSAGDASAETEVSLYHEALPGEWDPAVRDYEVSRQVSFAEAALSSSAVVFRSAGLAMLDPRTGGVRVLSDLRAPEETARHPALAGDHLLWEVHGFDRFRIAHARLGADTALYHEITGPEPADVLALATDGVDVAWQQGYQRHCVTGCSPRFDRVELWTAPFVPDPADLRPRRVTEMRTLSTKARLAAGRYAVVEAVGERAAEAVVIELATGRRATWRVPEGWAMGPLLALSRDELVVIGRDASDWTDQTLFRARLDSLTFE